MPSSTQRRQRFPRSYFSQPLTRSGRFLLMAGAMLLTGDTIGRLIYAALGQAPSSSAWNYSLTLYIFLCISATSAIVAPRVSPHRGLIQAAIAEAIAHSITLAIIGFYHIGNLSGRQPQWAVFGAIGGAIIGGILSLTTAQQPHSWQNLGLASLRTTATYGAAFSSGTIGLMSLSVGQLWGSGFLGLCALYLVGTGNLLIRLVRQFR
ncbi:hypothetical protein IQ266_00900 [filamentous cyanobacterium LEGE 11480]|uniref:Uncharacterized protein n=1 Tax=Romeriopsis navalis LEGE 11480 TaxID=2777977 RepID=A0A928VIC9_9CYAN|nr:hypothetical protein [Romeriopsis navalis]MBE9028313.1 hypothetical protein [Romeriopsis navalis LEGE 11480]